MECNDDGKMCDSQIICLMMHGVRWSDGEIEVNNHPDTSCLVPVFPSAGLEGAAAQEQLSIFAVGSRPLPEHQVVPRHDGVQCNPCRGLMDGEAQDPGLRLRMTLQHWRGQPAGQSGNCRSTCLEDPSQT